MRRFSASLLTLAVLTGQLALYIHQMLVPHAICAQHGEWVEAGEAAQHGVALSAQVSPSETSLNQGGLEDSHEHCAAMVQRREDGPPLSFEARCAPSSCLQALSSKAAFPLYSGIAVYRTAPKNSPPL